MAIDDSTVMLSLVLLVAMPFALWFDLRYHRLPNWLTLSLLLIGLLAHFFLSGLSGLLNALGGGLLGLLLFLPFYLLNKGMGAGDVKMMAAVGAVLGVQDGGLCIGLTLIFGSIFGLLFLLYKGGFVQSIRRYWLCLLSRSWVTPQANDAASLHFPYALAIASGVVMTLYLSGKLSQLAVVFLA